MEVVFINIMKVTSPPPVIITLFAERRLRMAMTGI